MTMMIMNDDNDNNDDNCSERNGGSLFKKKCSGLERYGLSPYDLGSFVT